MYSLYVVLKYALHWMVITFKNSGNIVHKGLSSIFHMIAIYEGTPYFCSFYINLYDTCYMASSVRDISHIL